ncbi:MAG: response regulator [Myxococcota bacterium]
MAMRLADMDALELARRLAEAVPLGGARLVVMTPPGDALRVRRHAPELDRIGTPVRVSLLRTWLEHPPGNAFRRTPHEGTPRVRPRSMQPTRILVAEENPTNQKYAVALLERMGHRCAVVENGREAVRAALQEAFDLVLMDVMMPEMDGLEATRAIRERELEARPGRHLPIVALTADVLGGARDECMRAGCDDFLEKPVTPSQLEATVSFWLAREPAQAPDADLN